MIRPILDGEADVVYGSRYLAGPGNDSSRLHRFGNAALTTLSNWMTGLHLTDMETCYKAFRRAVLRGIPIRQNRFGFEPEITAKIARRRLRVEEVPIGYRPRSNQEGKKIGLADAFNAIWCILRYGLGD